MSDDLHWLPASLQRPRTAVKLRGAFLKIIDCLRHLHTFLVLSSYVA